MELTLTPAFARVVPQGGHQTIETLAPDADMPPGLAVQPEMGRTSRRVDDRGGSVIVPTEAVSLLEGLEDRLRQGDVPAEGGVHRVVKQRVVEQAVDTDRVEEGLAVDEDAA